jgi:hypothetical protein
VQFANALGAEHRLTKRGNMAGKMVPIAHVVSRSEASVIASMLDAAGILSRTSADRHASVDPMSIAFGSYLITVPDWQHEDASAILSATFAVGEFSFSEGLQTAVIKLLLAWVCSVTIVAGISLILSEETSVKDVFLLPFAILTVPVNPQGRSDYYLSKRAA